MGLGRGLSSPGADMRTVIIVFILLALAGLLFGWLLSAQAGADAVAHYLAEWTQRFTGAE